MAKEKAYWVEVLGAFAVVIAVLLGYLAVSLITGYYSSLQPPCPAGWRAVSVDGMSSLAPASASQVIRPNKDFPTCSEPLTCPPGIPWAVRPDGSSLTNTCDVPNCECSTFQHCPAYVDTVFRQFGRDQRVSLFQVTDPGTTVQPPLKDPYDPPYILYPGNRDMCFLTTTTLNQLWPPLTLGQECLRGKLSTLQSNPSLILCAPDAYVTAAYVFEDDRFMANYKV